MAAAVHPNICKVDKSRREVTITLLLHASEDQWGFECQHGKLWKPTQVELFKAIRFIFGVRRVIVAEQRLSY
jgi:hypothetical protein